MPSTWTQERARLAALSRHTDDPDDPKVAQARQSLKAARAEDYVRKIVESAPPLTGEQRTRLAAILRGGGDAA